MATRFRRLEPRRRFIALAILLTGLAGAIVIYLNATAAPANPLGYEPADSKQYLREMEVYGGKANVLAFEFREWFDSLWHGKRLAFTVMFLTLVAVLLYLIASTPIPPQVGPSRQREREAGEIEQRQ